MMAAALAEGTTVLENAACEPEVTDLAELLNRMGGTGRGRRHADDHDPRGLRAARGEPPDDPRPDRGRHLRHGRGHHGGDVTIRGCRPDHLDAVLAKLEETGARVEAGADSLRVVAGGRPKAVNVADAAVPGVRHGHAGADHGAHDGGRGAERHHRVGLREPVHARERAPPDGGRHHDRGEHGRGPGGAPPAGRPGDGHRSPGQRLAGGGRPGRPRRDGDLPDLPPGPGLRGHRGQADRPWAPTSGA